MMREEHKHELVSERNEHEAELRKEREMYEANISDWSDALKEATRETAKLKYRVVSLGARAVLDGLAEEVTNAHKAGIRKDACKNVRTTTTTECLRHLLNCECLPLKLRQTLKKVQAWEHIRDTTPQTLFEKLSATLHKNKISLAQYYEMKYQLELVTRQKLELQLQLLQGQSETSSVSSQPVVASAPTIIKSGRLDNVTKYETSLDMATWQSLGLFHDTLMIPSEFEIAERHLLVAVTVFNRYKFKYIDEEGNDMTEELEPDLRTKIPPPPGSRSTSAEELPSQEGSSDDE